MRWGFTGSQKGCDTKILGGDLDILNLKSGDWLITGACIGVDAQIFHLAKDRYPEIPQLVIFPYNRDKIDTTIEAYANDVIWMPQGTDYRDRNERIVAESDRIIAFWTGKERSGTYMTMNIARRAGKLWTVVRI